MLPITHNLSNETIARIHTVEVREPEDEFVVPRERAKSVLDNDDKRINRWSMSELFYAALRLTRSPQLKHTGRLPERCQIIYTDSLGEFCNK